MDWILLVYESPDMVGVIASCLEPAKLEIVSACNLAEARKALRRHGLGGCKLIVSSLAPPQDAEQSMPADRGVPTAIEFLHEVRRDDGDAIAFILIDPAPTFAHNDALRGVNRSLVMGVRDVAKYLGTYARKLMAGLSLDSEKETHLLDIDISISGENCNWQLIGKNGVGISEMGSIKLDRESLDNLLTDSEAVTQFRDDAIDVRRKVFRRLGRRLYRCIDDQTQVGGLWEAVSHYTNRMLLLEKTRFRFQVDSVTSLLLVEALSRGDQNNAADDDYWMLRTPMVRRFGAHADRFPLFKDKRSRHEPVQCLIILGNPSKFSTGSVLGKTYPAIRNAHEEVEWLSTYLTDDHADFGLAIPRVLRYDEHEPGKFAGAVRDTLREGSWQLIHYSGHSDIGADGTGYLVLGEHPDDLIAIEDFARQAAHAQFIFLNSCRSANLRFVQRSVERSIPAVAGYAWPIRDDIAAASSREFYSNLFGRSGKLSNRFLEYAFLRARRYLHETYADEAAWSSPLLFMQSMNSEPDFGSVGKEAACRH